MKSTNSLYRNDNRLYLIIFATLSVIAGVISHPVKTSGHVKTLAWTLQQIMHCIPLHLLVTYCVSRSVICFQLLMWRGLQGGIQIHDIAGILVSAHALHSWYKLVKGEPIEDLREIILIGILLILPSFYVIVGGALQLPRIPKRTDLVFIKIFVSMIFFTLLQLGAVMLRLLWVIAARNNENIVFLRLLGKAIGATGLASYSVGFVLIVLPIIDWLRLLIKGQAHDGRATPVPASDKTKRSCKWFFWDLWFVRSDAIDSELVANNSIVINIAMPAMLKLVAYAVLFLSSPFEGSGLEAAIQENNATFLSMATFMEALATSATVTMMFDGSLLLIGRKTAAELQTEFIICSICMFIAGFVALSNGVIENFPQFLDMMMM